MSQKIGRNDPCPCGSGKKYKRCCLKRDQEAERLVAHRLQAVDLTLDWLAEHHEGAEEAGLVAFFGILDPEVKEEVEALPLSLQDIVWTNAYEWLVAEGTLVVDGEERRIAELVLADPDSPLDDEQRRTIEAMSTHEVGLYEVTKIEPHRGVELRDRTTEDDRRLFLADHKAAEVFELGALLGLRLLPDGDAWQATVAVYPFELWELPEIQAAVKAERAWSEEGEEPKIGATIVERFLEAVFYLEDFEDEEGDEDEPEDRSRLPILS